jgi:carbamoyltransferase
MDIAASIQVVTEEIVLKLATTIHKELEVDYLCLAGGVALNCVANGRLDREGPFEQMSGYNPPLAMRAVHSVRALATWHRVPRSNPVSRNDLN